MSQRTTLAGFAQFLAQAAALQPAAERAGLVAGIHVIAEEARAELGHYQEAAGPFPAWRELAESTKEQRRRLGYTPNDPLLRSGELRASIEEQVEGHRAVAGTNRPEAAYLENGTSRMPPRPFMGSAGFRKAPEALEAIAEHVFRPLRTGKL